MSGKDVMRINDIRKSKELTYICIQEMENSPLLDAQFFWSYD